MLNNLSGRIISNKYLTLKVSGIHFKISINDILLKQFITIPHMNGNFLTSLETTQRFVERYKFDKLLHQCR